MTRSRHLWSGLVAVLLAASGVRALTSTPFGGQRGSSTTNSPPISRRLRLQATQPGALNYPYADNINSRPQRALQSADPDSADASASAAATSSTRKQLLPLSARDVIFFLIAAVTLALAAASGIGGGVLLVPLLSMVGGFQFIEAVALSNVACLAGAVTNLMFNISRKNPVRPGPLIDYDLLLLFGPPIVLGSVAGAKANYFIPSWITKTLLLLVLAPMVWRMVNKAKFLWVAESEFKRQALAEVQAAAADTDVDNVKAAAAEAAEDGTWRITNGTGTGARIAATASAQAAGLRTTLSSLRQAAHVPKRCSSAAAAAAAMPAADELDNNDLRCAYSDDHVGPRLRPNHSSRRNMRPLPEATPSTNLVDVLGPDLMLLTSPAAATAAVQVQHAGRELQRQRLGPSRSLQHALFLNFSVPAGNSKLDVRGSSFRARSMVTGRGTGSCPASRASSWEGAEGAGTGVGAAARLGWSVGGTGVVGSAAAADVLHADASAPAGGVGVSASQNSSPDRSSSAPVQQQQQQQQQQQMPDVEGGCAVCDPLEPVAALEMDCNSLDVMTPFALHQRQLSFRQGSLKRFGSDRRQGSFVSSMGPAGSETAGHGQYTIRQLYSAGGEEAVQCKDVQVKAGPGAGAVGTTAGGKDVELPVAGKSQCLRLSHKDCCHTPELEDLMMGKIEYHASHQYPKIHLAGLLGMLLVVVATAVCSQFLLQCGTWQFWLVVLSPIPTMIIIWALTRWHVLWRVGWQECLGLMSQAEIAWTHRSTLVYPAICTSVGVLAGLLGIGGGTVMAPMLLELGVHPQTSAASSQAAILISTATAAVVYLVNGSVPHDYGITIILVGFLATLIGQTAITYLVRRTGRNSLLVFILAFLFVAALGLCVAAVGVAIAKIVGDPSLLMATRKSAVCYSSKTV